MDATFIRFILIVLGALVILGLYLWERRQERTDIDDHRREPVMDDEPDQGDDDYADDYRQESAYSMPDDDDDREQEDGASMIWPSFSKPRHSESVDLKGSDEDEPEEVDFPEIVAPSSPGSTPSKPIKEPVDIEPLLVQVSVSARRYPFQGPAILELAETCGLHPGEMDIFHCLDEFDDGTRTYFSMANMVKPGVFPFDAMDQFSTPGLLLFAQLKGDPEDMTILDEMIATARKLALGLNGDVLDDSRRPLTVKKEEDMRMAVYENELRWAKAILR